MLKEARLGRGLLYRGASGEFAQFQSAGASPGTFTQLAFEVDDIEATVAELRERGELIPRTGRWAGTRNRGCVRHSG